MQNFPFDIVVRVKSFTMTAQIGQNLVELKQPNGYKLTAQMTSALAKVKRGGKVWFEGVKATLPDGSVKDIGTIALKVR